MKKSLNIVYKFESWEELCKFSRENNGDLIYYDDYEGKYEPILEVIEESKNIRLNCFLIIVNENVLEKIYGYDKVVEL